MQRHSKREPCPICGGNPDMLRGKGQRCAGWSSDDGWVHCSREEFAGQAKFHSGSQTWSHRATGKCPCGDVHRPGTENDPPPRGRRAEVRQIGEAARAEVERVYDYQARDGSLLYQVLRMKPKSFRQRRPHEGGYVWHMTSCADARKNGSKCMCGLAAQPTTLFHIPELFAAIEGGDDVWIVEGEKDVETLAKHDITATCNTGGAGKWRDELATPFEAMAGPQRVRIIQDADDAGRKHAREVFDSIVARVADGVLVEIFEAAAGKDATDHFEAKKTVEDFRLVWPLPKDYAAQDPAGFKRLMLRQARVAPESAMVAVDAFEPVEHHPLFPVGLVGELPNFRQLPGVVVVSGAPSSGKSYLAIGTAIDAALAGWDVFYLNCEMHRDLQRDRAARANVSHGADTWKLRDMEFRDAAIARMAAEALPDTFHLVDVGIGVTLDQLNEFLVEHVTARPSLVLFDSLSSFVDNLAEGGGSDTFKMRDLREVMKWIVQARRLTSGRVSFVLISELNKEGRAKGRFVDHRSDVAIAMVEDGDTSSIKHIRVTKSWWTPTGTIGAFHLDRDMARLVKSETSLTGKGK